MTIQDWLIIVLSVGFISMTMVAIYFHENCEYYKWLYETERRD